MSAPAADLADPWADAAERLSREVMRRPYLSLLAAGGFGCLLAGDLALRMLPGLANLGVRLAVATALPTLADVLREFASPDS